MLMVAPPTTHGVAGAGLNLQMKKTLTEVAWENAKHATRNSHTAQDVKKKVRDPDTYTRKQRQVGIVPLKKEPPPPPKPKLDPKYFKQKAELKLEHPLVKPKKRILDSVPADTFRKN
jgi:hypothetical protein